MTNNYENNELEATLQLLVLRHCMHVKFADFDILTEYLNP